MRWPLFYVYEISLLSRRGEIQKNNSRGGFLAGRMPALLALVSGQSLRFNPRAQIRFELGCKTPPNSTILIEPWSLAHQKWPYWASFSYWGFFRSRNFMMPPGVKS